MAKGYTKYSLDVAFKTSSPNTFKLYQYFSHFKDKQQIQCSVDTIKKWLLIENKYHHPSKIKEKILVPASKELKEKADVWFEVVEHIKKGRKMLGWKFKIYTKEDEKEVKNNDLMDQYSEDNKNFFDRLVTYFCLSEAQAGLVIAFCQQGEEKKKSVAKVLYEIQLQNINKEIKHSIGGLTATKLKKSLGLSI